MNDWWIKFSVNNNVEPIKCSWLEGHGNNKEEVLANFFTTQNLEVLQQDKDNLFTQINNTQQWKVNAIFGYPHQQPELVYDDMIVGRGFRTIKVPE